MKTRTLWDRENSIRSKYSDLICGIDEAGCGAVAGPLVVACVCFDRNGYIEKVRDSKRLTPKTRENLYYLIKNKCISWGVTVVSVSDIDSLGVWKANEIAMKNSYDKMLSSIKDSNPFCIIDKGSMYPLIPNSLVCYHADDLYFSVAAASIVAKVLRDRIMFSLSKKYPVYSFEKNKGYVSNDHLKAIRLYGVLPGVHRSTFKIKSLEEGG